MANLTSHRLAQWTKSAGPGPARPGPGRGTPTTRRTGG
jgi:hypothetical protein